MKDLAERVVMWEEAVSPRGNVEALEAGSVASSTSTSTSARTTVTHRSTTSTGTATSPGLMRRMDGRQRLDFRDEAEPDADGAEEGEEEGADGECAMAGERAFLHEAGENDGEIPASPSIMRHRSTPQVGHLLSNISPVAMTRLSSVVERPVLVTLLVRTIVFPFLDLIPLFLLAVFPGVRFPRVLSLGAYACLLFSLTLWASLDDGATTFERSEFVTPLIVLVIVAVVYSLILSTAHDRDSGDEDADVDPTIRIAVMLPSARARKWDHDGDSGVKVVKMRLRRVLKQLIALDNGPKDASLLAPVPQGPAAVAAESKTQQTTAALEAATGGKRQARGGEKRSKRAERNAAARADAHRRSASGPARPTGDDGASSLLVPPLSSEFRTPARVSSAFESITSNVNAEDTFSRLASLTAVGMAVTPTLFRVYDAWPALEPLVRSDAPDVAAVAHALAAAACGGSLTFTAVFMLLTQALWMLLCTWGALTGVALAVYAYHKRLQHASSFAALTSVKHSARLGLPCFHLQSMEHIRSWLMLRSYLQRLGPQWSVEIILTATFLIETVLLVLVPLDMYTRKVHLFTLLSFLMLTALGIMLIRILRDGAAINRKYNDPTILMREELKIHFLLGQPLGRSPDQAAELKLCLSTLKVVASIQSKSDNSFRLFGVISLSDNLARIAVGILISSFSASMSTLFGIDIPVSSSRWGI